jgi:DNA-binding SARP family transcriptional activator
MAATAVMLAKLTRPRVGQAVTRDRLFAAIDRLRDRPVVWIAAQPGAGKTTLLASFLKARKLKELWYQVDAGDADPASFFYHLGLAAKGQHLPLLTAEYLADIPGFARRFFRELYQRMGTKSALVFDNLQEAPEESPFHKILAVAFDELPEGIVAFVASRSAPPAIYAPLLARSKLGLIEAAEMRLTREEVAAIAHERDDLDDAAIASLAERSGGWAAGVTLLMERAGGGESVEAGATIEALHQVFAHFAEQLIEDDFKGDLDTLLQLGFVARITPAVARELTGGEAAGALLEKLHRRNLFTERRRAGTELTYQFHHLMQAFLRQKARDTWTRERWREVAAHAAAVLQANGGAEDALPLLRELEDWEGLAAGIVAIAPMLLAQERRKTLIEWIVGLPEATRQAHPWLLAWQGTALAHVAPAEARACFEQAHAAFVRDGDQLGRMLAATGIILAHSYELADLRQIDRWSEELSAVVESGTPFPTPGIELRVQAALLFAHDFSRHEGTRVFIRAARVFDLLGSAAGANEKVSAAGLLLGHYWHNGKLDEGLRLVTLVESLLASPEVTPANRALWATQAGWFACWRGDTRAGYESFDKALAICAQYGLAIPVIEVFTQFGAGLCAIQDRDFPRAEAYRARAESRWKTFRRIDVAAGAMLQCALAGYRGDADAARQFAREHLEVAQEVGVTWQIYNAMLANAFVAAESKRHSECAVFAHRAREFIAGTAHAPFAYQSDLVEAYSALLQKDEARLRELLARGLAGGNFDRSNFFLRIQPRLLPTLYAAALERGIEVDFIRRSIRELRIAPPEGDVPNWPWPLAIRTLGKFEVQRDGRPLEFSRKAPKKTLQLLKAIIAGGGRSVREQTLLDALWGDEEGDAASKSLGAAVLRLRNLLGDSDAVVQQGGALSLDRSRVWVDAWAFEQDANLALYAGAFLTEEEGAPWPVPMRERLRARFIQRAGDEGSALEKAGRHDEAIDLYMRGIDADPIVEPFYQGLMRCYAHLDRRSEAAAAYRRLKQILSVTLGLPPSATTERLYRSLHLG